MRGQVKWLVVCGVAVGTLPFWAFGPVRAWADKKENRDKVVHELMEKTHEGKHSPWKSTQGAAAKDPPDWEALAKSLPALEEMSKALTNSKDKEIAESADSYVSAVKALGAGAAKKDGAAVKSAVSKLSKSCADCHFKGGPGGKLEDEDDDD